MKLPTLKDNFDITNQTVTFTLEEKHNLSRALSFGIFGSARLGVLNDSLPMLGSQNTSYNQTLWNHVVGKRTYEFSNHLGNVLSVISDKVIPHVSSGTTVDYYMADIRQSQDYSPFGVTLYGRNFSLAGADGFRFGFNGMEGDDELKGDGNSYDFGARMLDPRLGRWLRIDPLALKYPAHSPYHFSLNSPLMFNDPDGKDAVVTVQKNEEGGGKITISSVVYITGKNASKEKASNLTDLAGKIYKSGTFTSEKGENFEIVFDVKFEYVEDKSKLKLEKGENILNLTGDPHKRSFIKGSILEIPETGQVTINSGRTGEIGLTPGGWEKYSILHETLHLLGLSDRYDDKTDCFLGFSQDIMGAQGESDISQIHYDNFGKTYYNKAEGTYTQTKHIDVDKKGKLIGGDDLETMLRFDIRDSNGRNKADAIETYGTPNPPLKTEKP